MSIGVSCVITGVVGGGVMLIIVVSVIGTGAGEDGPSEGTGSSGVVSSITFCNIDLGMAFVAADPKWN